ncbi:HpcH/HpaI aldolase family protein [Tsukamurella ocularis]|uniref:HpcH/HpaI aldolase family protein n=1 Tax=Tsukamurella ocularis TaxID=1970234 RepID=UPI00216A0AB5|nr:aldolase/citrate lyase family protein [Tsukamurella ocularis]MCS3780417.1 4-hydroxy-2-oxoheptanedioate aldolase [Tsukamurella ocularis]MCS3786028.1 4-hydroxy-2-oxoheptanedioate aldolase [Tsukamurella ocularis]MCS3849392.1 4-hydroxy-2-oxoheptanedioate aldolase [Tsukamurella ocularis]
MLQPNRLKEKLQAADTIHGLFSFLADPTMIELIGYSGYDFVIIDTEHTLVDPHRLEHLIRAAETAGITPLVRVPTSHTAAMTQALDAGAMGIVAPRVSDPADVGRIARATRYFPLGERGLNGGRMTGFGHIELADYLDRANAETMLCIMIEDQQGIERLPEMLAAAKVDLVLSGTADLSQSLGLPWQLDHPNVREAEQQIHARCREAGVAFCALSRGPAHYRGWHDAGVRAFVVGNDRGLAGHAFHSHLEQHRQPEAPIDTDR